MMKGYIGVDCLCTVCNEVNTVFVKAVDYRAWYYHNMLAQNAFPYLTPEKREMLISGTCPRCFKMMMGIFENEEEDE